MDARDSEAEFIALRPVNEASIAAAFDFLGEHVVVLGAVDLLGAHVDDVDEKEVRNNTLMVTDKTELMNSTKKKNTPDN